MPGNRLEVGERNRHLEDPAPVDIGIIVERSIDTCRDPDSPRVPVRRRLLAWPLGMMTIEDRTIDVHLDVEVVLAMVDVR